MATTLSLPDLVSTLKDVPREQFNPEDIVTLLADFEIQSDSVDKYERWINGHYTRNLVYRDETFELLVLCWPVGIASPIHNHAGQDCWVYVHRGGLCLEEYALVDPAQEGQVGDNIRVCRGDRIPRAGRGAVDYRGPRADIHRVFNCRSFKEPAVSLHLYAKPFDDCIIYDPRRGRALRKALSYYSVEDRLSA